MSKVQLMKPGVIAEWERLAKLYPIRRSIMVPALLAGQKAYGYVTDDVVSALADFIGIEPVEVMATASFYVMLYKKPAGKYVIQVCHNISCYLNGAENLIEHIEAKLGVKAGETTPDGKFSIQRVECIANCDHPPTLMINEDTYGDLTAEKFDEIISKLE